jgi:D-alanyl-D-alanine carboxypeptidase (penicillin-binding protein 5/6)
MKKKIALGLSFVLLSGLVQQAVVQANETTYVPNAKAAIMLDADSGTILFEKSSHRELPPASITKMMSMLLIIEAIHKKQLRWDEKVTASEHAAAME